MTVIEVQQPNPEDLELVKHWFKVNGTQLADLRKDIEADDTHLAELWQKLENLQPEIMVKIDKLEKALAANRKTESVIARSIRESANNVPQVAREIEWLIPRKATVVEVSETFAFHLAMAFLPGAIKLDRKQFDKWAIANQMNKLLVGVTVNEVEGFVIPSDLSAYETSPDDEVPF